MSLSNFNHVEEKIPKPVDKDIIKEQEQEFGSMSEEELLEQKELLYRQVDDFSAKPIVENTRVVKESEEEKNEKIRKNREFLGI